MIAAQTSLAPLPDAPQAEAHGSPGCVSAPFVDVPIGHTFCHEIAWFDSTGITEGFPDGTFRPGLTANRQAVAVYLHRLAGSPDGPGCGVAPFVDVPVGHGFCEEIAWFASTGITTGFPDGTFRPLDPAPRQAVAVYLHRLAGSPDGPGCGVAPFVDVPVGHGFCEEIAWFDTTGITDGFPDGTFRPLARAPRQAIAAFFHRGEDFLRTVPPDLGVEVHVAGLSRPWDLAFAPDETLLFTERVGRVSAVVGGVPRLLAAPADVYDTGEGGMMGIAVDPDFDVNRRIYTCFNSDAGGPPDVRVVRWVVDAGWTALGSRTDIVTGIPSAANGRHSGCRTRFGPDGHLWVTTGDAAIGSTPQDPDSLAGKVLRIDTDGDGAPGNPGSPLADEIYTYGHRNPQGLTFDGGGDPYSIEHGPGCDDEVNALVVGGNYGWDPVPVGGGAGYDEAVPMTDLAQFPSAVGARWSSGCPTIAPSGGDFVAGDGWMGWDGALAVAVLKDHHVRVMKFVGDELTLEYVRVADRGRLRAAVQGPDGALYLAQDASPGGILRVVPSVP